MRFNELAASRAAFAAGISPEVIYAEPGALVLRYIEGRALSPELVRDAARLPRVVDLVKRCHEQVPHYLRGPSLVFWVFQVIRGYATELQAYASPHVGLLPQLVERAERLEREVQPVSIVFGHNDLLAANFIDDGKRLWLIDWDYAGFNSPLFDLGGLVSNSELDADQTRFVLERYFGKVESGLERRFAAMKCASLLRETMWSMVSEVHSKVEFDYAAYTRDYLARFGRAYDAFAKDAQ
jgi:thiamine kinase-like enzyme